MKVNVIELNSSYTESVRKMLPVYNNPLVSSDSPLLTFFPNPENSFKPIQTINPKSISHKNLIKWYESLRQDEHWSSLRKELDQEHSNMFIKWINQHFIRHININSDLSETSKNFYRSLTVRNLFDDLADGLRIIYLLEIMHRVHLSKEIGKNVLHKIKNFQICINFMETERKVACVGINTYDLIDGNQKIMLAFLFLIKHDYETTVYKHKSLIRQYRIREKIQTIKKQKLQEIQNEIEYEKQRNKRKNSHKSRYSKYKQSQQSHTHHHQCEQQQRMTEQQLANSSQRVLRSKSYSGSQADFLPFDNSHGFYLAKHLSNKSIDKNLVDEMMTSSNMTSEMYDLVNGLVHTNAKVDELYTAHVKSYSKLNDTGFQSISKQSSSNRFGDSNEANNRYSFDNEMSSLKSESFGYSSHTQINPNRLTLDGEQISNDLYVHMASNNYDIGYNSLPSEIDKDEQHIDESSHVNELTSLIDNDLNIIKSFELKNHKETPKHSSQIIELKPNDVCLVPQPSFLSNEDEKVNRYSLENSQNIIQHKNEVSSNENEIENEPNEFEPQTSDLINENEGFEKIAIESNIKSDENTNEVLNENKSDLSEVLTDLIESNFSVGYNQDLLENNEFNSNAVQSSDCNQFSNEEEELNQLNKEVFETCENCEQSFITEEQREFDNDKEQDTKPLENEIENLEEEIKEDKFMFENTEETLAMTECSRNDSESIDLNLVENLISQVHDENLANHDNGVLMNNAELVEDNIEKREYESAKELLEDHKNDEQTNEIVSLNQTDSIKQSNVCSQIEKVQHVSITSQSKNENLSASIKECPIEQALNLEQHHMKAESALDENINKQQAYLSHDVQRLDIKDTFECDLHCVESEICSNDFNQCDDVIDINNNNKELNELKKHETVQVESVEANLEVIEEKPVEMGGSLIINVIDQVELETFQVEENKQNPVAFDETVQIEPVVANMELIEEKLIEMGGMNDLVELESFETKEQIVYEVEENKHNPVDSDKTVQLNKLTSTDKDSSNKTDNKQRVIELKESERAGLALIEECPIEQALSFEECHMKFVDEPKTDSFTDTYKTDTLLKESSRTDEIEENFKHEIEMYNLLDQQGQRINEATDDCNNRIVNNELKATIVNLEDVLNDSLLDAQNETFNSEPSASELDSTQFVPSTIEKDSQADSVLIQISKLPEIKPAIELKPCLDPINKNLSVLELSTLNPTGDKRESKMRSNKKTIEITSSDNQKLVNEEKMNDDLNGLQGKSVPNEHNQNEKQKTSKRTNQKSMINETFHKENINTIEQQTHQKSAQDLSFSKQQNIPNRDMASNYLKENAMNFQTSLLPTTAANAHSTINKTVDMPVATPVSTKSAETKSEISNSLNTSKGDSSNKKKSSSKSNSGKKCFAFLIYI